MALQPILLFVDETYLADGTGQIQTAVPVPQSLYDTVLVPECRKLLAQFGPEAKEFKGGSLKPKNHKRYKQFLRLFRNLAAIIAQQSPLRMVITLDGSSIQSGEPLISVHQHIALALKRVGIIDSDQVAQGFSRQLVWLKEHFEALTLRPFSNPLVVVFDNRYRYSQEMQRQRAILRNGVELASCRALEDVLTIAANCLLEQWKTPMPLPQIQQMTFRDPSARRGAWGSGRSGPPLLCGGRVVANRAAGPRRPGSNAGARRAALRQGRSRSRLGCRGSVANRRSGEERGSRGAVAARGAEG